MNINSESWHMQCVEQDGFSSWVRAGRRDPRHHPLPVEHVAHHLDSTGLATVPP